MDWNNTIQDLRDHGLSERAISDEVNRILGTEVSDKNMINRIRTGYVREPRWSVGAAIITLHQHRCVTGRQGRAAR